jgi:hypothetical protein
MKVYWRKTWHQDGFTEVSESEDEDTQRQQAQDFAAAQEPTTDDGPNRIQWGWTEFFSEAKPDETDPAAFEVLGADGTKYVEWFDI